LVSETGVKTVKDMSKVGIISVGMVLTMTEDENVAEEIVRVFGVTVGMAMIFGI